MWKKLFIYLKIDPAYNSKYRVHKSQLEVLIACRIDQIKIVCFT